jgi:type VI protein secretion system component VasF
LKFPCVWNRSSILLEDPTTTTTTNPRTSTTPTTQPQPQQPQQPQQQTHHAKIHNNKHATTTLVNQFHTLLYFTKAIAVSLNKI